MQGRRKGRPYRRDQTALEVVSKASVLRTSDDLGWSNLNVSLVAGGPDEYIVYPAVPDLWLVISLAPTKATLVTGEEERGLSVPHSRTSVIAPGTPVEAHLRNKSTSLHVFVRRALLVEVASELFESTVGSLEITSSIGVDDPGLASLLYSLEQSLFEPAGDADLKVEYLARALAAHVLRKNANLTVQTESAKIAAVKPLTYRQALRVKKYILDHLCSKILLKDLTALLDLGQTNFINRFVASFRLTCHCVFPPVGI